MENTDSAPVTGAKAAKKARSQQYYRSRKKEEELCWGKIYGVDQEEDDDYKSTKLPKKKLKEVANILREAQEMAEEDTQAPTPNEKNLFASPADYLVLEPSIKFHQVVPEDVMSAKLYPSSKLTHEQLKNNILSLSKAAKADTNIKQQILNFVDGLMPEGYHYCTNWKEFSQFLKYQWRFYRCYYCPQCKYGMLHKETKVCSSCNGSFAKVPLATLKYFVQFDVADIVKHIFHTKLHLLQQTLGKRSNANATVVGDIYGGEKYVILTKQKKLGDINQISFMVFWDGMVKNEQGDTIWMLWACVNEFPIEERFKSENLILLGLWCHSHSPPNCALAPFVHQIHLLKRSPPSVKIGNTIRAAQCVILGIITDFPARSKVTGFIQFNGRYGCPKCLQRGVRLDNTNYYPWEPCEHRPLRTKEWLMEIYRNFADYISIASVEESEMKKTEKEAISDPNDPESTPDSSEPTKVKHVAHVRGVKAFSVLSLLPDFDMCADVCLELMHCVSLGVIPDLYSRTILKTCDINLLNEILQFLKIPREFKSWSLDLDYSHRWNAIDWRYFLTYYFVPILQQTSELSPKTWELWISVLFINWCSSASSMPVEALDRLHVLTEQLVQKYQTAFKTVKVKVNLHSLLHLSDDLRRFGMAWTHSAWCFESQFGVFGKGIKGPASYLLERLKSYQEGMEIDTKPVAQSRKQLGNLTQFFVTRPAREKLFEQEQFPNLNPADIDTVKSIGYFYSLDGTRFDAKWHTMQRFSTNSGVRITKDTHVSFAEIERIFVVKTAVASKIMLKLRVFTHFVMTFAYFEMFGQEFTSTVMELKDNTAITRMIFFKVGNLHYFCDKIERTTPSFSDFDLLKSRQWNINALKEHSIVFSLSEEPRKPKQPQRPPPVVVEYHTVDEIETVLSTKEEVNSLLINDGQWTASVIHAVLALLSQEVENMGVVLSYAVKSPQLLERKNQQQVLFKFATSRNSQLLFLPLNADNHWTILMLAKCQSQVIAFHYDSLGGYRHLPEAERMARALCQRIGIVPENGVVRVAEPEQTDGVSCGFYVCRFAVAVATSSSFPSRANIFKMAKSGFDFDEVGEMKQEMLTKVKNSFETSTPN